MQFTSISPHRTVRRWATLFCVAALLFTPYGRSQIAGTGNIQGTVTDSTGAVIANASVTLTDQATQVKRTTTSNGVGTYLFPGIPIGTYNLRVAAHGFQAYDETGIVLEVGSNIAVNPSLAVGSANAEVEVHAEGLALQTEDASFKQTVDQQDITEMPLNSASRQITGLLTISGGSNTAPGNDFTGSKYSYQTIAISIAGSNGNTTLWRLDGGDNEDYMANGNLPFPFPDAVNQFSVESTVLGAQDGDHTGGLVNVVTRSGTNKYRGSAFEFIRNNLVDATNFYSTSKDTLHQNEYGGTFGGPVKHDKLFAFAAYQHLKATQTQASTQATVPTAANLEGDYSTTDGVPGIPGSNPCNSSHAPIQLVDPLTGATLIGNKYASMPSYNAASLALQKYLPAINPSYDTNNCGFVSYAIPLDTFDNQFVTRVDFAINSKNSLYGRYFIDGYQQPPYFFPTNILVTTQSGNTERVQSFTLGDAYTITPNLVNAIHVTILRRRNDRGYSTTDINANTLGVSMYQGEPYGLQLSNGKFTIGGGSNSAAYFNDNTLSLADDVTWIRGKHQFMFGGEWVQNQLNISNAYDSNGVFTFNGQYSANGPSGGAAIGDQTLDFLQGTLSAFQQSQPEQLAYRGPIPSLYAQDTYRASKRLTLVGGLRWGPNFMPVDYFNRGSVFNREDFLSNTFSTVYPTAPAGVFFYGDRGVPRAFTKNSPWQFSPNVGLSFDPVGDGNTVIRAGAELAYDKPNFFTAQANAYNPPFAPVITNAQTSSSGPLSFSNPWSVGAFTSSPFPMPFKPSPSSAIFYPQSLYVWLPAQFHAAYTIQWTLSVQHNFSHGWQAQIDYIGNGTRHDPLGVGLNPAVYIPGNWGAGGTGCAPIVTTGPAAVSPGAAGTPCSTSQNEAARFALTIANPAQGNQISGGGTGSFLVGDEATANYNGLIASLNHRLSSTFSLLANWTWSKCLNIEDAIGNPSNTVVENPNNPSLDYGPCGSDYRHIENIALVAKSRFNRSNRMERLLINDWEIAPLIHISTGAPVNVTEGADDSLTDVNNDRPNLVPGVNPYFKVKFLAGASESDREYLNPNAFAPVCPGNVTAGCAAAGTYGNVSRNEFRTPPFFQFDSQISRIFPIHGSLAMTFRVEAFNVLNHPDFGSPEAVLTSPTFGQISSTATGNAARVFQGCIKVSF